MQLLYFLKVLMTERVSTLDVRQRLGDMLNRVALRHDEFVIERKGKTLAALVSIERLEQMRGIARRHAVEFLQQRRDSSMTDRDAMALANHARRWARRRQRRR